MGFFDKLFEKGKKDIAAPDCAPFTVYAPAEGKAITLAEFPDEIFSQGVLGSGCGILPDGDTVFAPFNGVVTQLTDTRHAIGVTSSDGVEVLIHVGVDTVEMAGTGFQNFVKEGQKIVRGEPLISFDRAAIQAAGHSDAIAVVVTNGDEFSAVALKADGGVAVGDALLKAEK